MDITIRDGIIIGSLGGFFAGIAINVTNLLAEKYIECRDKKRIFNWLYEETKNKSEKWRSTRAIQSYNNLTEDRVRYICSIHKKIALSTGKNEDMWGIIEFTR
jgi:hypothetical protein